jgi:hypothetical protein
MATDARSGTENYITFSGGQIVDRSVKKRNTKPQMNADKRRFSLPRIKLSRTKKPLRIEAQLVFAESVFGFSVF